MHRLHLLRHAKSSRDEGIDDKERPLSRRGRDEAVGEPVHLVEQPVTQLGRSDDLGPGAPLPTDAHQRVLGEDVETGGAEDHPVGGRARPEARATPPM